MKSEKKPSNKLSEMEVLKDLRALFSNEDSVISPPAPSTKKESKADDGRVKELQASVNKLEVQNSELQQKLEIAGAVKPVETDKVLMEELRASIEALKIEKSDLIQKLETASAVKPVETDKALMEELRVSIEALKVEKSDLMQKLETASAVKPVESDNALIEELKASIEALKAEKSDLNQKLEATISAGPAEVPLDSTAQQLKDRIDQLTEALADVEDLLRFQMKDLMKKLGNAVTFGGFEDMGIELRKGAKSLESAEYFGYLLRYMMNE